MSRARPFAKGRTARDAGNVRRGSSLPIAARGPATHNGRRSGTAAGAARLASPKRARAGTGPARKGTAVEIAIKAPGEFSPEDEAELQALRRAVYPPEEARALPGRHYAWSPRDLSVLVRDGPGGVLHSHAGIVVRRGATLGGAPVALGGVGYVQTRPEARGRGFAGAAVRRAAAHLAGEAGVDFCLLFCRSHLIPFYRRLGWEVFEGRVLAEQPPVGASPGDGAARPVTVVFNFAGPMVRAGRGGGPAPRDGELDLRGLPW